MLEFASIFGAFLVRINQERRPEFQANSRAGPKHHILNPIILLEDVANFNQC